MLTSSGADLAIDGLWGLRFGNGGFGGTLGTLYFTAGPDNEVNGLLVKVVPNPEPATWWLSAAALLPFLRRRRRA